MLSTSDVIHGVQFVLPAGMLMRSLAWSCLKSLQLWQSIKHAGRQGKNSLKIQNKSKSVSLCTVEIEVGSYCAHTDLCVVWKIDGWETGEPWRPSTDKQREPTRKGNYWSRLAWMCIWSSLLRIKEHDGSQEVGLKKQKHQWGNELWDVHQDRPHWGTWEIPEQV